jgi:outer membrane protein insertion porin family
MSVKNGVGRAIEWLALTASTSALVLACPLAGRSQSADPLGESRQAIAPALSGTVSQARAIDSSPSARDLTGNDPQGLSVSLPLRPRFPDLVGEHRSPQQGDRPGAIAQIDESQIATEEEPGPQVSFLVLPQYSSRKGIYGKLDLDISQIGDNHHSIELDLEGGERTLGGKLTYTDPWTEGNPFDPGFRVQIFNTREPEDVFREGDPEAELIHDHDPFVDRLGGKIEVFRPIAENGLTLSAGVGYQRVAIRNAAATDKVFSRDEFGNRLTLNDEGIDNILTVSLAASQDRVDDRWWPTQGYRFRLGTEQSVPIGEEEILFNRISASYSQFVPLGSHTLAFNLQGGTFIGDVPPYDAFSLGGTNSVRGYGGGEVGSGRSFVQGTAEYRFPIVEDLNVPLVSRLGGTVFVDYATDLGSGDTVVGEPAEVRNKPGNGFGFGVGVRALTRFGPVRLEFALNDDGDAKAHFTMSDRF